PDSSHPLPFRQCSQEGHWENAILAWSTGIHPRDLPIAHQIRVHLPVLHPHLPHVDPARPIPMLGGAQVDQRVEHPRAPVELVLRNREHGEVPRLAHDAGAVWEPDEDARAVDEARLDVPFREVSQLWGLEFARFELDVVRWTRFGGGVLGCENTVQSLGVVRNLCPSDRTHRRHSQLRRRVRYRACLVDVLYRPPRGCAYPHRRPL
ncbi:unnamed protein product, partial [Mycena citricolor]